MKRFEKEYKSSVDEASRLLLDCVIKAAGELLECKKTTTIVTKTTKGGESETVTVEKTEHRENEIPIKSLKELSSVLKELSEREKSEEKSASGVVILPKREAEA